MNVRQGGLANSSGNTLEQTVIGTLQSKGFVVVPYVEYERKPDNYGGELLLRNVPYQTIYGHRGKTEFLLKSAKYSKETRIECKWQQSSGSVDEKFPYLYLNCVEAMPEQDILIIVDGGGAKEGAVSWLREASSSSRYCDAARTKKNIQVMSLMEFIVWANMVFR